MNSQIRCLKVKNDTLFRTEEILASLHMLLFPTNASTLREHVFYLVTTRDDLT